MITHDARRSLSRGKNPVQTKRLTRESSIFYRTFALLTATGIQRRSFTRDQVDPQMPAHDGFTR